MSKKTFLEVWKDVTKERSVLFIMWTLIGVQLNSKNGTSHCVLQIVLHMLFTCSHSISQLMAAGFLCSSWSQSTWQYSEADVWISWNFMGFSQTTPYVALQLLAYANYGMHSSPKCWWSWELQEDNCKTTQRSVRFDTELSCKETMYKPQRGTQMTALWYLLWENCR